ncbi:hypothetical protein GF343_02000 [Candidatus Woesearchaeota archaeon]|nr:hypothetical protein [Candidatus Woesearchaeota archaeon]
MYEDSLDTDIFDLSDMSLVLKEMLGKYADLFRPYVSFGDFASLRGTPGKNYTARTEVPVHGRNKDSIGTLYALVFQFQDGTGNDSTFKPGDLELPGRFKSMKDPRTVFPRSKQGIRMEAFFPFFTALDGKYHKHAVCLEELTVDNPENPATIIPQGILGLKTTEYSRALRGEKIKGYDDINPPLFLTCGYKEGARFGDPHAIYHSIPAEGAQVAGFLAVPDDTNADLDTLGILFKAKGKPPLKYDQ